MTYTIASRFADRVRTLSDAELHGPSLPASLRIEEHGAYSCFYAPFDHVNDTARVVLVGITPGREQAQTGLKTLRDALRAGMELENALARAKATASFCGSMRANLVEMLEAFEVQRWLAIDSCSNLFTSHTHLVHYTSALRYPVFEAGENYSGNKRMHRVPMLERIMNEYLAQELALLEHAIIVPLGPSARTAVEYVASKHRLRSRILLGPQHPAGQNIERILYLLGKKPREALSSKTNAKRIDEERAAGMKLMKELLATT